MWNLSWSPFPAESVNHALEYRGDFCRFFRGYCYFPVAPIPQGIAELVTPKIAEKKNASRWGMDDSIVNWLQVQGPSLPVQTTTPILDMVGRIPDPSECRESSLEPLQRLSNGRRYTGLRNKRLKNFLETV